MLNQTTLREGHHDDFKEIRHLFIETVSGINSADYDNQQIAVWISSIKNEAQWNEKMKKQFILVAQYENKLVGFISLEIGNHIDLLYVHKDFQRQGIAKSLYTEIEKNAKAKGQKSLTSEVSITAKPFFEQVGFKVMKKQIVTRERVELVNFKMIKEL